MDELRRTADTRPGYATWPDSKPGSPSWWARHGQQPPARPVPPARPWTGPEPLMSFGPPMILAPVDEHDDEQERAAAADEQRVAAELAADRQRIADLRAEIGKILDPKPAPEPRRWWHWITRGMT